MKTLRIFGWIVCCQAAVACAQDADLPVFEDVTSRAGIEFQTLLR